jgi:hypothetical protein
MSCQIWQADGEPRGSCHLQTQMLHVGMEVPCAEQQRQVGRDAGGGDDPVDFVDLGEYLNPAKASD